MKILIELSHPKHYYQFRYLIFYFKSVDDEVIILARDKDVLLSILKEENVPYIVPGRYGKGLLSKFLVLPKLLWNYSNIIRKFKPDIILSKASPYAIILKPLFKAKVVITPDSEVVKLTKWFVAPFSDLIITPKSYSLDHGSKHKRIDGFFEETYLSPKAFIPDAHVTSKYNIDHTKPYFVLRFVSWEANHDIGHFGFSNDQKVQLFEFLSKYGKVYISAERKNIPDVLSSNILKIDSKDIHHVLSFANAYVGDSQTMATESALLGTPSFRFNSFVGDSDMSNFTILENVLGLLKNFNNFDKLMVGLKETVENTMSKTLWSNKRNHYFQNKPDLNEQILALIHS